MVVVFQPCARSLQQVAAPLYSRMPRPDVGCSYRKGKRAFCCAAQCKSICGRKKSVVKLRNHLLGSGTLFGLCHLQRQVHQDRRQDQFRRLGLVQQVKAKDQIGL